MAIGMRSISGSRFSRPSCLGNEDNSPTRICIEPNNQIVAGSYSSGLSTFRYDDRGNVKRASDPTGAIQSFDYEPQFNQLSGYTDVLRNLTSFDQDAKGNPESTTYADGSIERYGFDAQGNLERIVDRRGQVVTYTYDGTGLLRTMRLPDGSLTTYNYDSHANLTSVADGRGTVIMQYDGADRLTKITYPNGRFLQYSYDAGGRRTQSVDQSGFTVNYSYDAAGRLSTMTDGSANLIVRYTYDHIGNLAREDQGNGTYTTYDYYANAQLLSLVNFAPDNSVNSRFDYTYDALGRRDTVTTLDGTTTYGYDAIGQLASVMLPDGRTIFYQYDGAGNRVLVTDNGAPTIYTSNNLNQYTDIGGITHGYDTAGNLDAIAGQSGNVAYTYDALNRLVSVTTPNGTWTYEYDALGNRIATVHNGQRREYLIDPAGLGNVVGEYDGVGQLIAHYTHGLGLTSRVDASNTADYYDFDAIGSTVGLTGSSGGYVNRYSYLPFGEILSATETVANSFRYNGAFGVQDDRNGLNFMRARFYDPSQGRFTQPDPIGLLGGTNLYEFVANDPVSLIDPSGLAAPPGTTVIMPNGPGAALRSTRIDWADPAAAFEGPPFTPLSQPNPLPLNRPLPSTPPAIHTDPFRLPISEAEVKGGVRLAEKIIAQRAAREALKASLRVALRGALHVVAWAGFIVDLSNIFDAVYLWDYWVITGKLPPCNWKLLEAEIPCEVPTVTVLPSGKTQTEQIAPNDPNFISGPAGFGVDNFIAGEGLWPYVIGYENKSDASAPAQQVIITQQLDVDLDLSTFQLGDFGFGDLVVDVPDGRQVYNTRIDYRATRGVFVDVSAELDIPSRTAKWTLTSIDPTTLDIPANPIIGFLPPNVTAPQGDGYVSYFVRPQSNLLTGTRIEAQASIVFDVNAPVLTNVFTNTLDAGPPASVVAPLPSIINSPSFTVSWSSVDDGTGPVGSGISTYDVFVSDNGAAFAPFLVGTTATSATFNGAFEHTYRFFSVATDNVGRREADAAMADAITTVKANNAPVANNDSYTTAEDATLVVAAPGVLANDADPDAGTTLTAAKVTDPMHGTLTLNADGSFSYTPALHYFGPDSFTYKVNDGAVDSSIAAVTISVDPVNDAPTVDDQSLTTEEDKPIAVILSGADVEIDPLPFIIVAGPQHGTLTGTGATRLYTPAANYLGADSFTFKVNDGQVDSNIATVSITVTSVNDAPVAGNDGPFTVTRGGGFTLPAPGVLSNDLDIDSALLTALLGSQPANGTVTLNPDGSFTYTNDGSAATSDSFTYKANDGQLDSNVATVSFTIEPPPTGSVTGVKFHDLDFDGLRDAGEPGLQGWTIFLDENGNDRLDAGEVSTVTGADGSYAITGIAPGHYRIDEVLQPGWRATINTCFDLTLVAGQTATQDFANFLAAEIRGAKFNDLNGNGVRETGEPGLADWTIFLDMNGNREFDLLVDPFDLTDAQGNYALVNLFPGAYAVREVLRPGWTQTAPANGLYTGTLAEGQSVTCRDFGNFRPGAISGVKFQDLDRDGVRDAGEPGLADWMIFLDTNRDGGFQAGEPNRITDATGAYQFTDLGPDEYLVREVLQAGWLQTTPAGGVYSVVMTSGLNATGRDFGNAQNAKPVANPDTFTVDEGGTLIVPARGVLINDSDIDNLPAGLTAALVVGSGPTFGVLQFNADGSLTYTHDGSETLSDYFKYRVFDGVDFSDPATVTININPVNDMPTITSVPPTTGTVGTRYTYEVKAFDPDPGDVLTFTLRTFPVGMAISAATGLIEWTPTAAQIGTQTVTVRVTDRAGSFKEQTFTIAVAAPVNNGDLDGDGDVDLNDLQVILRARNTRACGPNDWRDVDGDGRITVLDARKWIVKFLR